MKQKLYRYISDLIFKRKLSWLFLKVVFIITGLWLLNNYFELPFQNPILLGSFILFFGLTIVVVIFTIDFYLNWKKQQLFILIKFIKILYFIISAGALTGFYYLIISGKINIYSLEDKGLYVIGGLIIIGSLEYNAYLKVDRKELIVKDEFETFLLPWQDIKELKISKSLEIFMKNGDRHFVKDITSILEYEKGSLKQQLAAHLDTADGQLTVV